MELQNGSAEGAVPQKPFGASNTILGDVTVALTRVAAAGRHRGKQTVA